MATDAQAIHVLTLALHDSLMVLAPGGWIEVELELRGPPSRLRVNSLRAQGGGGKEPPPPPPLNIEVKDEALRLGEGLTELVGLLAQTGKQWQGGKVQVSRGDGFADWKLLRADGSTLWFTRLARDQVDRLVFTDALFELLRGTERAFRSLQDSFAQKLGPSTGHRYSESDRVLTLITQGGAQLRSPAQLVGSYSRANFFWVWGWAVEQVDAACSDRVKRVCAPDAAQPGLSALWRDHFHCDEGFAWALASHVAVSIGARGLVRAEEAGNPLIVAYAVMSDPA